MTRFAFPPANTCWVKCPKCYWTRHATFTAVAATWLREHYQVKHGETLDIGTALSHVTKLEKPEVKS